MTMSKTAPINAPVRGRDALSHLRGVPMFAGLEDEALLGIATHCRRRTFPAGAALFYENDPGHALYLIVVGTVVIEKTSGDDGSAIFLAERGPGDVLGEMALLDNQPRSATALAQTDCEALLLDRDGFHECIRQEPSVALQIMALLSQRLRESNKQAARQGTLDALGRVAAFLIEQADRQGPTPTPRRVPRRTDREVGERIGATRETVSRKMSRLVQMRVVRCEEGQVILLDEKRLRALCAGG